MNRERTGAESPKPESLPSRKGIHAKGDGAMNHDIFDQKVETLQERLQAFRQQTGTASMRQLGFSIEVLGELATALEELHVAQEELQQQNEELISAQHAIAAE